MDRIIVDNNQMYGYTDRLTDRHQPVRQQVSAYSFTSLPRAYIRIRIRVNLILGMEIQWMNQPMSTAFQEGKQTENSYNLKVKDFKIVATIATSTYKASIVTVILRTIVPKEQACEEEERSKFSVVISPKTRKRLHF